MKTEARQDEKGQGLTVQRIECGQTPARRRNQDFIWCSRKSPKQEGAQRMEMSTTDPAEGTLAACRNLGTGQLCLCVGGRGRLPTAKRLGTGDGEAGSRVLC